MEATYFAHQNCIDLSTRPSVGAHKPSCLKLSHGPFKIYNQSCFHNFNRKITTAKCYPSSSLLVVAASNGAQEDDNRELSKGRSQKRQPTLQRAYSFNSLTIGSQALKKILNLEKHPPARDPSELVNEFEKHLMSPRCDPEILQELAWKLEMSGKEKNAVQLLIKKLSSIERDLPLGEEAITLRLLLVELLIYQGKYYIAKVLCESLMSDREPGKRKPGDGKRILKSPLYLAIIYELMDDSKNSKLMWEDFQRAYMPSENLLSGSEGAPQFDHVRNMLFLDFQIHIEDLKEKIDQGRMSMQVQIDDDFSDY